MMLLISHSINDYSECYKERSGDQEELDNLTPVEGDEEKYYSVTSMSCNQTSNIISAKKIWK